MNWRAVTVKVNKTAADAVINILKDLGAEGVVINSNKKQEITAYYPDDDRFPRLFTELKSRIHNLIQFDLDPGQVQFSVQLTRDEDWSTSWHKYFKPVKAGKEFLICPGWEDCSDSKRQIINIDPGIAFGIGNHITTRMALTYLEKYVEQGQKMLDIGVGTGILSIAAARLGIKEITGIDIDRAAIRAARKNIKINNVDQNIKIKESNLFSEVEGKFSLVIANMLPTILLKLFPGIKYHVESSGLLILSGINGFYEDEIHNRLHNSGFRILKEEKNGDWRALVARKEG